ncbi:glucose-6-phosphate isomerase [Sporosarcina sp. FA9]|uniref:glucose-6-phosphate isomerase n=1 Tax=Sporosarcina sp. FA9 TaxID=3413030 RepID=UPI003F657D1F
MSYITFDYSRAIPLFNKYEFDALKKSIHYYHNKIQEKEDPGHNSLGWLDYPVNYNQREVDLIKKLSVKVQNDSEILLVIGIGGSYTGARAGIEMLTHSFHNQLSTAQCSSPKVFFVGNHLSSIYMNDLMEFLEGKDFSINVISKSGTTLEPAIAFRIFRKLLVDKYGEKEARSRIYVTTDNNKGRLKAHATIEGYETFVIPKDIGGRFSVLTSVGLFPMAVSGICIDNILKGAARARVELNQPGISDNIAYQYAAVRNLLYKQGKTIELLISYEPSLHYFSEWWKQLFAESEGKEQLGIFPASATFSTDLHSLGQYIQEGRKGLFETVIKVEKSGKELEIVKEAIDFDDLNYLNGQKVSFINEKVFQGTLLAHTNEGIPNIIIEIPEINGFTFGYLTYFFQLACTMSGYLLGVNPFNQPGVEVYKNNMYFLLGRSEYKEESVKLTQ